MFEGRDVESCWHWEDFHLVEVLSGGRQEAARGEPHLPSRFYEANPGIDSLSRRLATLLTRPALKQVNYDQNTVFFPPSF